MGRRCRRAGGTTTCDNFRAWTDRSRENLGVDTLDLVQLHCPPTPCLLHDAVYDALDTLVRGTHRRVRRQRGDLRRGAGRDRAPRVASVQIIFNMLRLKPLERCCRPPPRPASGSSRGCRSPVACSPAATTRDTTFAADDHRTYNRHGEAFDVGETFSGVDFETVWRPCGG